MKGFIQSVKCKVCSLIESKDKIIGCKWDTLTKHACRKIVVRELLRLGVKEGGTYIAIDCAHLQNMKLYVQRGPKSILTQVNKLVGEGNRKMVQMKALFHVFTHGHPMLEYKTLYELFASLGVLNNPTMH
jgi:hypothetical protein